MKLLAVFMALTIFAGSQAFVLRDESISEMEKLKRELHRCTEAIYFTVFRTGPFAVKTETEKVLDNWIKGRAEDVKQRLRVLGDAFPPEVEEVREQVSSATRDIRQKLWSEHSTFERNVAPETQAFEQALASDLNPVLENLQPLRQSLVQSCVELSRKLTEMQNSMLEKLQPRAEKVQEQLREVECALDPIVGHVQKYLVSEVEGAREVLQRSAARVLEVFNKYRESFDRWVQTPLLPEKHGEQ